MAERDLTEPTITGIAATIATGHLNSAKTQLAEVAAAEVVPLDLAGQTPSRFLTALNKLDFEPNPFEQSFSQIASPESESPFLNPDTSSGSTLTDSTKEASLVESPTTTTSSNTSGTATSTSTATSAHSRRSSAPNPNIAADSKNPASASSATTSTTAYKANKKTTTSVSITKTSSLPSTIASTALDSNRHQQTTSSLTAATTTTTVVEEPRALNDKRSSGIPHSSPRIVLPPAAAIDSPNPAISNIRSSTSGVDFGWDSLTKGPLSPILLSGPKDSSQPLMSKSAIAIHRSSAFATSNSNTSSNSSSNTNGTMKHGSIMMSTSTPSSLSLYSTPASEFISNNENRKLSSSPLATVTPMRSQDISHVKSDLSLDSTINPLAVSNGTMPASTTITTTAATINANDSASVARFSTPAINPLFAKAVGLHPNTSDAAQLSPRTAALFAAATQEHMAIKREEQVRAAVAAAAAAAATASINTTIDPIALSAELAPLPTVIAPNQLTTTTMTNDSSLPGAVIATTANLAALPLAAAGASGFDGTPDTISLSEITQLQSTAVSDPTVAQMTQHYTASINPLTSTVIDPTALVVSSAMDTTPMKGLSNGKPGLPEQSMTDAALNNTSNTGGPYKRTRRQSAKQVKQESPPSVPDTVTTTTVNNVTATYTDSYGNLMEGLPLTKRQTIDRRRIPKVKLDHLPAEEREKRQSFLERNRLAALKCRQRKKAWLQQLQHKIDNTNRENEQLQEQATSLREEIINLKTLLLAHKDCRVARANGMDGLEAVNNVSIKAAANAVATDLGRILVDAGINTNGISNTMLHGSLAAAAASSNTPSSSSHTLASPTTRNALTNMSPTSANHSNSIIPATTTAAAATSSNTSSSSSSYHTNNLHRRDYHSQQQQQPSYPYNHYGQQQQQQPSSSRPMSTQNPIHVHNQPHSSLSVMDSSMTSNNNNALQSYTTATSTTASSSMTSPTTATSVSHYNQHHYNNNSNNSQHPYHPHTHHHPSTTTAAGHYSYHTSNGNNASGIATNTMLTSTPSHLTTGSLSTTLPSGRY